MTKPETWPELLQRWLPKAFPAVLAHSKKTAQGDRGVLAVKLSIEEMHRTLAGEPMMLDQVWVPADEFMRLVRQRPGSISAESLDRWETQLRGMDAKRDVALFLNSADADENGTFFTRFIVTHDGNATVQ